MKKYGLNHHNVAVFDGHNDLLTRLWLSNQANPVQAFIHEQLSGQLDLKRCQQSGFAGGMFAIFLPPFAYVKQHYTAKLFDHNADDFTQQQVEQICLAQLELAQQMAQASEQIRLCTSVQQIQDCRAQGQLAVVLHMEGAEALQNNSDLLDIFYQAGLRSVGPLWNRISRFGHGLNARFPHSPDTGAGLTAQGKALVKRCADKKMLVDVSHMNERAFWDTAKILQQPIVATHSNAHALCPQARNLTDSQLQAIAESGGMVGVNFDVAFLRTDGQRNADTPLTLILDHLEYMMERLGEDHIGLGSDFDGALISTELQDVTGLPLLIAAMQQRHYSAELIEKICWNNWLKVMHRIWA